MHAGVCTPGREAHVACKMLRDYLFSFCFLFQIASRRRRSSNASGRRRNAQNSVRELTYIYIYIYLFIYLIQYNKINSIYYKYICRHVNASICVIVHRDIEVHMYTCTYIYIYIYYT